MLYKATGFNLIIPDLPNISDGLNAQERAILEEQIKRGYVAGQQQELINKINQTLHSIAATIKQEIDPGLGLYYETDLGLIPDRADSQLVFLGTEGSFAYTWAHKTGAITSSGDNIRDKVGVGYVAGEYPYTGYTDAYNAAETALAGVGGRYILADRDNQASGGTAPAMFTTSAYDDLVLSAPGRNISLGDGSDRLIFGPHKDGLVGANDYFKLSTTTFTLNGGAGFDGLDIFLLTNPDPSTTTNPDRGNHLGLARVTESSIDFYTGNTNITPQLWDRTYNISGFEEIRTGLLASADFRRMSNGIKLVVDDGITSTYTASIWGSAFEDTLVIDSTRYLKQTPDLSARNVSVDAGEGHDYVVGELITGAV